MNSYLPRLVDAELQALLTYAGGVSITGPRACGKTSTAKQASNSWADLTPSSPDHTLAQLALDTVLEGETPRLLDEWQTIPTVWDGVRRHIDARGSAGQFILTGSAWPETDARRHSGAGRISRLTMRTLSLFEEGLSTGEVSLSQLFNATQTPVVGANTDIRDLVHRIVRGGWPGHGPIPNRAALRLNRDYLESLGEHDFPYLSGNRRTPVQFRAFIRAYAALIGQPASLRTVERRMNEDSRLAPSSAVAYDMHEFCQRLFLIEDQPAWSPQVRSRSAALATPKRHLADPSLACAALDIDSDRLFRDPETLGIFFESFVVHNMRCYAQANDYRSVAHYRDQKARKEIDLIVERHDGSWAGFEVKLGTAALAAAAESLLKTSQDMLIPPVFLGVIVPTGRAFQLDNGVWAIPLDALGP